MLAQGPFLIKVVLKNGIQNVFCLYNLKFFFFLVFTLIIIIMNIIKGLGSYTFECLLIYIKSMVRGTTPNSSETYYNMKEKDLKSVFEIIGKSHYQGQKRTQRLRCAIL